MTQSTHCTSWYATPGVVPATAVPVCPVSEATMGPPYDPGAGSRRGVLIYCHPSENSNPYMPLIAPTSATSGGTNCIGDFLTTMATNGWLGFYPALPVDFALGLVSYPQTMATQTSSDGTHGTTFTDTLGPQFDHWGNWIKAEYNLTTLPPIVLAGWSLGAWWALRTALQKPTEVVGCVAHALPTLWENLNFGVPPGTETNPFSSITCTGIDLSTSSMSGYTVPTIIGFNGQDDSVGYATPGTGTMPASPFSQTATATNGTSTLTFAAVPNIRLGHVVTGAGITAPVAVTAINSGSGVVTVTPGSGGSISTLTTSSYTFTYASPVSNTDQIIQLGGSITGYQNNDSVWPLGHLLEADANTRYETWMTSTGAGTLNTSGSLYPVIF